MKPYYIAQIDCKAGGCFRKSTESLDEIRTWANKLGNKGETLTIMRSGTAIGEARIIII